MSHAQIVGVGQTEFSRSSGRSATALAVEAVSAALADAGLEISAIDGVVPYPLGPTVEDLVGALGLTDVSFTASAHLGGASTIAGLGLAAQAVLTRAANVVVTFAARNGRSQTPVHDRVQHLAGHHFRRRLEHPHGLSTPAEWYSLMCRRHMIEFGTSREALADVALTMREHAQLNPHAQMHGRPLDLETYFAAPMIADPYCLYDCCLETDGAAAVVVTRADMASDLRQHPVAILAVAEGHPDPPDDLASRTDLFATGLSTAAPRAFAISDLTPEDVDVALIYDCFTFEVIQQLEEAGFCPRGEGGAFVLEQGIGLDSPLPVNPHGGLLSEGHLVGMNHVVEAVVQLRGAAGPRQVLDACTAVVTGWGDLGDGSMAVLKG